MPSNDESEPGASGLQSNSLTSPGHADEATSALSSEAVSKGNPSAAPAAVSARLARPVFIHVDETSLTFDLRNMVWDMSIESLWIQYKEPRDEWAMAKAVDISSSTSSSSGSVSNNGASIAAKDIEIFDLKPGTPYIVRYFLQKHGGSQSDREYGPEAVFDTMPVDCTPKKKKCIIM